jgi:hypothetical protein
MCRGVLRHRTLRSGPPVFARKRQRVRQYFDTPVEAIIRVLPEVQWADV